MKRLAEECLNLPVACTPFVPEVVKCQMGQRSDGQAPRFDFLYVASGEAHKNHAALISAWCVLADEGLFPSLALTLASEAEAALVTRIAKESAGRGLRIHNLGSLPHDQLVAIYRQSGALIYPSGFESFGLPLIEARLAGIPILAPELDYVRDITDPDETFDPRSVVSIARAVRRHLQGRQQVPELPGGDAFLEQLIQEPGV
jgi:glycosyltransferase involved in cell wall biosynthesis